MTDKDYLKIRESLTELSVSMRAIQNEAQKSRDQLRSVGHSRFHVPKVLRHLECMQATLLVLSEWIQAADFTEEL